MKRLITMTFIAMLMAPLMTSAHTIALGGTGAPGSVTIWLGSYHFAGGLEGCMTLTDLNGSPITPIVSCFNVLQPSGTIPAGLTAGVNLFYATDGCCVNPAGTFNNIVNGTGQTLRRWQSVTFTGLAAGLYDYTISGMNTVIWRDWSSNTDNWSGQVLVVLPDTDGDGVLNDDDFCPDNTVIPEGVPTSGALNPNHWALTNGDGVFDTVIKGKGKGPNRSYTIEDTAGCSCEQIIEIQGLGDGHSKHGCSISAMDDWIDFVNP